MKCLSLSNLLQTSRMVKQAWGLRHFHLPSALLASKNMSESKTVFDPHLLDILACPLSKKSLRYDQANNELVCEEIGVAYPIVDGIPNLNPIHGRMLHKQTRQEEGNNDNDR